jgi:hypothetical protein
MTMCRIVFQGCASVRQTIKTKSRYSARGAALGLLLPDLARGRIRVPDMRPTMTKLRKKRAKRIKVRGSDLLNMVDAVFVGVQDDQGWVVMCADTKGRECIDALFPKAHIAWKDDCGETMPSEWRAFSINLPEVVAETETRLPLEITRGADLDEAAPDALAFLLAMGVRRQGGRSAVQREGRFDVYIPEGGVQ